MKKTTFKRIGQGITLSLLTSTLLHATNGDHLIAVGTKARGMGGAGIAVSHCAESTLHNPALITCTQGTSVSFGGTIFMPDISTQISSPGGDYPRYESDADINVIPTVSISHKLNENWYIGVGMWGTAGMGADYRNATQTPTDPVNMNMVTNLQLMQFGVSVAYRTGGFGVAVTPILQYGALDINYKDFNGNNTGDGVAQDLNFGFNLGAYYDFTGHGIDGLTLGAVYKSKINMDYSNQLSNATQPFVDAGIFLEPMGNDLEQPAEIGFGIGYQIGQHTFAVDYKIIQWSDAKGYKDFAWEDQDVFALGYQYAQDNWKLRLGYNHASSAVVELDGAGTPAYGATSAINFFNLLGFPATAEDHYTVGGTYAFTEQFAVDMAYVYSPTNTETFDVGAFAGMGMSSISTDHQENSISMQLSYKF